MNHFYLALFLVSLLGAACSHSSKVSSSDKVFFSGRYACPEVFGKKNSEDLFKEVLAPFEQIIDHRVVNDKDVLVVDYQNPKEAPYDKMVWVADDVWRFSAKKAQNGVIAIQYKAVVSNDGRLQWWSKVPAHVDQDGTQREAIENSGTWWIEPISGDKKSESNFVKGTLTCKRVGVLDAI